MHLCWGCIMHGVICTVCRVMLYDPDWNPSTDMQARERAWRIGQVCRSVQSPTQDMLNMHSGTYQAYMPGPWSALCRFMAVWQIHGCLAASMTSTDGLPVT